MREHLNHNKKDDVPPGIRRRVWLVVFGLVLVCMLLISGRHGEQPAREVAVEEVREQNPSLPSRPKIRTAMQTEVRPGVYEDPMENGNVEIDLSMVEQMVQDRCTWMDDVEF